MPRFYCPTSLTPGALLDLPASAARHVQVLRLQPGDVITLFNGGPDVPGSSGGEFEATVTQMGRSHVQVQVGVHTAVEREAALKVHLAVGMPANERMDWLVEKAAELGVASIQPLMTERSVLRLSGERADKKQAHWQSVAVAACEQCGGNRVPRVHAVMTLAQWLKAPAPPDAAQKPRLLLVLAARVGRVARSRRSHGDRHHVLVRSRRRLEPCGRRRGAGSGFCPGDAGAARAALGDRGHCGRGGAADQRLTFS